MHAGYETPSMRRDNYQHTVAELKKLYRSFRDGYDDSGRCPPNPAYCVTVPSTSERSPPVGEMDDTAIDYWARRMGAQVAEMSINQSNESLERAKRRSGEAA